MPRAGWGSR